MSDRIISIDSAQPALQRLPTDVREEIDALWVSAHDSLLVHKATNESLTGEKTFQAKTTLYGLDVNPLSPASNALVKLIANKTWALDNRTSGDIAITNQTDAKSPLVIAAAAVDAALQILAGGITLGTDLNLGSHNLTGIGNANVANGIVQLDGNGRIPSSVLTVDAMQWKGTWNASTNTPALADGTGSPGDTYRVTVGGTRNLGSGNITFDVGDWAILSEALVWQKADMTDAVNSVAGLSGDITAAALRTALSLVIGTNVQAQNANLQALAGLVGAADQLGYFTGSGAMTLTALTATGRAIIGAANQAAGRTALGLGAAATMAGNVAVPVWFEIHAGYGVRTVGYMDNAMGFTVPTTFLLGTVIYHGITADASGSTTVELRQNGTQIATSVKAITAANQWAQGANTTAIIGNNVNTGDVLRPYISGLGTTPGNGFGCTLVGTITVTAT